MLELLGWDGGFECGREFGRRGRVDFLQLRGTEFVCRRIEHDAAAGQSDNAVGEAAAEFDLMQADDRGDPVFAADAVNQFEDPGC
jgi:hypothetical protein